MSEESEIAKELTESQKKFCLEWIFDFNGTRAYSKAYPEASIESCNAAASRLLANVNIKAYCKELQDNLAETSGISRLKVIREHEKLAFSSIAHLHDTWITRKAFEDLTEDQKSCIASIETQLKTSRGVDGTLEENEFIKIKLYDKQKALDSITKMLGFDSAQKIAIQTTNEVIKLADGTEIQI